MTLDDRMRAAADALRKSMDPQHIQRDYELLEADYRRRLDSPTALHRLDDEIAGLDLEEASYKLARFYEREGRLVEAARWFSRPAQVDYADAAVRLAAVLEELGDQAGAAHWKAVAKDLPLTGEVSSSGNLDVDCRTAQARVDEFLHHDLPAAEMTTIRRHLPNCGACLEIYAIRSSSASTRSTDNHSPTTRSADLSGPAVDTASVAGQSVADGRTAVLQVQDVGKGRRIVGAERVALAKDLARRYAAGESIRSLSASTGRSYAFVHRVLTESGVTLRQRGGARRRKVG